MATMTTPPDGGTVTPVKKKPTPVAKYKSMTGGAPAQPDSLMVEKANGTMGPWGNDIPAAKKKAQTTSTPQLSDKARGYSNNYYTPNH